jgi:sulfhydrogenase subunit beta (sulfur reductase)
MSVQATTDRAGVDELLAALGRRGFELIGPTVRDGAIVYDQIAGTRDLPVGWTDEQDGGSYRLARREDEALFGYAVGPQSWKRFLHPPELTLWRARRGAGGELEVTEEANDAPPYAFIGVRSCELHAIAIQDRVLMQGQFPDPIYKARREGAFIVAVNCAVAGGTCFCVSMNTGPRAGSGYDLALTEVIEDGGRHYFLCEAGSERGAELMAELPCSQAGAEQLAAADAAVARAVAGQGRTMDTTGIKELLYDNAEHPRWDEVSERCLTCGNCTMVCPTCFCTTVQDTSDLTGTAQRTRQWDSCFTLDFTYVHGGSVRSSAKSRYRQWMTHKLASWIDQFGSSGCVGCGRCITWCPVAIDITEEVSAIRASDGLAGDGAAQ